MGNLRQMQKLLLVASCWTFFFFFFFLSSCTLLLSFLFPFTPIFCISSYSFWATPYIYINGPNADLIFSLSSMSLLVLSLSDVDAITSTFSPQDLQLLVADVFALISSKSPRQHVSLPPRIVIPTFHHTALFMPAHIGSTEASDSKSVFALGGTAVKVVCVPVESDPRGLPGTTLVLDEVTGAVKAVVNARNLTALRNAAGLYMISNLLYELQ